MSTLAGTAFLATSTISAGQLLLYLFLPVVGAIATMTATRLSEASNRCRDRYARALETLVAWVEFPYRVRRRTDDDPATLSALANHGHDLQERLAYHQALIASDRPHLARTYAQVRAEIDEVVSSSIQEAWDSNPVAEPTEMNLNGWGPGKQCDDSISRLQHEIERSIGFRRLRRWIGHQHKMANGAIFQSPESTGDSEKTDSRTVQPFLGQAKGYDMQFQEVFGARCKSVTIAFLVVLCGALVVFMSANSERLMDESVINTNFVRWMLSVMVNVFLASMVLFWWMRRNVSLWPESDFNYVSLTFSLSWTLFALGFLLQGTYEFTDDPWVFWLAVLTVGLSAIFLISAGIIGSYVIEGDRKLRRRQHKGPDGPS